eukprot:CAMPEP_0172440304 /NCGR_PEP_ID=MMETSP1065-20121228/969_1 /TAXON_ID=265537 /ORGANISM="Amphiprora paludosa, Strain CCMP125" /LENGTH=307 /DNA_ID=CAMNT_0013189091 /DNA_START=312 /DNA_END=1235 /DNA_ORIENTATION=-
MSSTNQDHEEMQREFEQFMLSGKASIPNKKNHQNRPSPSSSPFQTTPPPRPSSSHKKKPAFPKLAQHVQIAIDAFQNVLVTEWTSSDDQMYLVMESIANLRERIWIASREASFLAETSSSVLSPSWKECGFRGPRSTSFLLPQDVELSLSHSLLGHERMLEALRQGMAQLAQAQEAMGRRLDDVFAHFDSFQSHCHVFQAESRDEEDKLKCQRLEQAIGSQVDECLELFRAAASELFRKQNLSQTVLESDHDFLLYHEESTAGNEFKMLPKTLARLSTSKWARSHRESSLADLKSAIEQITKKINER